MRGLYTARRRLVKLIFMIGGPVLEVFTGGLFPETLTLAALLWIHNQGEAKNVKTMLIAMAKAKKIRVKLK